MKHNLFGLGSDDDFYNLIINKDIGTIVQSGANIEINTAGTLNLNQGLTALKPHLIIDPPL
jgi:hypothetical protein